MGMKCFLPLLLIIVFVSCSAETGLYTYSIPDFNVNLRDEGSAATVKSNIVFNKFDAFKESGVTVNNSDYIIPESILNDLSDFIESNRQFAGYYVIDLNTQMSIGFNAEYEFFSASTIKAGYALFCFKEITKGNAALSDIVKYEQKHQISGSGSTQNSVYGTLFTVKVLLYRMLYESDNVAYYMLIDKFGLDGYNDMVTALGCENTLSKSDKWGSLTPFELGLIWQEIYYFKDICEEGALLWDYLTSNLYNEIKAALPDYGTVAHKSGWSSNACHDAGIVFTDTPYLIVVMSENYSYHGYIHEIIRFLDLIMNDYNLWLTNG